MDPPFGPFWSAKYLYFGGESCEIKILYLLIQEMHTLRKVKNYVLFFQSSWEPNLSDLTVWKGRRVIFLFYPSLFSFHVKGKNGKYFIRVFVKVWGLRHHLDITELYASTKIQVLSNFSKKQFLFETKQAVLLKLCKFWKFYVGKDFHRSWSSVWLLMSSVK